MRDVSLDFVFRRKFVVIFVVGERALRKLFNGSLLVCVLVGNSIHLGLIGILLGWFGHILCVLWPVGRIAGRVLRRVRRFDEKSRFALRSKVQTNNNNI